MPGRLGLGAGRGVGGVGVFFLLGIVCSYLVGIVFIQCDYLESTILLLLCSL